LVRLLLWLCRIPLMMLSYDVVTDHTWN